ncbi:hypothetical protein CRG98_011586 [Punica granatum]|uniref:Retrovirus-related Pol polyprotein from transposon TNT 1-94 n=1 Tax=Punica granatum TaxID=22663 RepID=A0A2I0KI60_PUNGR|nr:hypothetical protein CRG98_011586 [Punica granatum]
MSPGTSMSDHIDVFTWIVMDLPNVDIKIKDDDQALLLLCSLPKFYKSFVDTILFGRTSMTLEDVKASLNSRELKNRVKEVQAQGSNREGLLREGDNLRESPVAEVEFEDSSTPESQPVILGANVRQQLLWNELAVDRQGKHSRSLNGLRELVVLKNTEADANSACLLVDESSAEIFAKPDTSKKSEGHLYLSGTRTC